MTDQTPVLDTPSGLPAIVVFGPDDKGKPHASSFKAEEVELAEKAARCACMCCA